MSVEQCKMPDTRRDQSAIDLPQLLRLIRRRLWILIAAVVSTMVLAYAYLATATIKYEAVMVLAEVEEDSSLGTLESLASRVNPFSASAGNGRLQRLTAMFSMPVVAQRLADKHGMLQRVFSGEWDEESKQWRRPASFSMNVMEVIIGTLGFKIWQPPSASRLADHIGARLNFDTDRNTGLVTVSFTHKDPAFAVEMLHSLYVEADNILRDAERDAVQARIAYAVEKLGQVTLLEQRNALAQLLTQLEQRNIQLGSNEPFAARLVQPPIPSLWAVSPRPVRILAAAMFVGLLIGVALILQLDVSATRS